jgi:uncharacterized protein YdeI (YjbR/CyaY-like superfamily)
MEVRTDKLRFFRAQSELRRWLERNHAREQELWIGFYKKDSGKGGITYAQALDEALCYGWIDGIRKKLDDSSFTMRFTPRRPRSIWSNVNVRHVDRLTKAGQMAAAGLAAFNARDPARTGVYTFEREPVELTPPLRKKLEQNPRARRFFDAQPPYYRRLVSSWVISAKKEETRDRRLAQLIACSAEELRIPQYIPAGKRPKRS